MIECEWKELFRIADRKFSASLPQFRLRGQCLSVREKPIRSHILWSLGGPPGCLSKMSKKCQRYQRSVKGINEVSKKCQRCQRSVKGVKEVSKVSKKCQRYQRSKKCQRFQRSVKGFNEVSKSDMKYNKLVP